MKKSETKWIVEAPLVLSPIPICLCMTKKTMRKRLREIGIPKHKMPQFPQGGVSAFVHFAESSNHNWTHAVVAINQKLAKCQKNAIPVLAHEAVHIWQEIRAFIGEGAPSSEFEAYSVQAITKLLTDEYLKQRKAIKHGIRSR